MLGPGEEGKKQEEKRPAAQGGGEQKAARPPKTKHQKTKLKPHETVLRLKALKVVSIVDFRDLFHFQEAPAL